MVARIKNSWYTSFYQYGIKHKMQAVYVLIAILLFVLFTAQIKTLIIITMLGIIATFSTFYKKVFQAPPAFELITLTVVVVSIFYGTLIGALYAFVVSLSSEIASQALDPFSVTYIFPRVIIAIIAPMLYAGGAGLSIPILGLLMSITYNALQQPVYFYLTDVEKRIKSLYFSSLNIPINFLVFFFLGKPLFDVLAALA
jgi:hypothetical protein